MRTITSADANRYFSKLLREVKAGETVVVTSRGEPVATIAPVKDETAERARRDAALEALLTRLRSQPALNLGKFNRDELYDDV